MNRRILTVVGAIVVLYPALASAQGRGRGGQPAGPPQTARQLAPIDLTGYWVSLIVDEWRFRVTPQKGDIVYLPLNAQARQIANAWDPNKDQADGNACKAYGAVGVMQIKPSTAEGPPINIKGVDGSTEKNIEAGVKYLRFIVDQYYKDEPMDRVNKGLFAIASYNAGPARIAGLRKKAVALGLDDNKWFGNVEVVASREIGRETVTYVSNIYKYYVSYRLIQGEYLKRQQLKKGALESEG